MADEPEKSGQEPNLELPSLLSFGRNRKRRKGEAPQDEPVTEQTAAEEPAVTENAGPLATRPAAEPSPEPSVQPRRGLAPSTDKAKRLPPVPPPAARTNAPAQQIPVPPPPAPPSGESDEEPDERDERDEVEEVEEAPVIATPVVVEEPAVVEEPPVLERATEQTTALPIEDPEPPAAVPVDESLGWPVEQPVGQPVEQPEQEAGGGGGEELPARAGTSLRLPAVSPRIAALVTGSLVGLLGVGLAYFAGRGCETVRGVGSCGGIGVLALLLIVAIQVVLGAILLKAWQLSDPTSTSFLGVGLVAVFVLLFLLSSLESGWMLLVIPVLSALTFLLSWWVTTAFVEVPGEDAHR